MSPLKDFKVSNNQMKERSEKCGSIQQNDRARSWVNLRTLLKTINLLTNGLKIESGKKTKQITLA